MKIGFTGTQLGMTDSQKHQLVVVATSLGATEWHHGDCVGADSESDLIMRPLVGQMVIHPPDNDSKRAFCAKSEDIVWEPAPYLERNHDIVNETVALIAAPKTLIEELRSGTWSTIRYARRLGRPVYILEP